MKFHSKGWFFLTVFTLGLLFHLFIFGDKGILAKKQAQRQLIKLKNELDKIKNDNQLLNERFHNLSENPAILIKEAQNLLILEKNSYMIRFISKIPNPDRQEK